MNKSDYHSKMLHILNDKTKFSRVKSDNNKLSNLSGFQRFLRRLKPKKLLEEDDYMRIYPGPSRGGPFSLGPRIFERPHFACESRY